MSVKDTNKGEIANFYLNKCSNQQSGKMTITVNNQILDFRRCTTYDSNIETNIWKSFILLNGDEIEFEVVNECLGCHYKLSDTVNWKGVADFLEKLPLQIQELKLQSQHHLFYLAKQMKFWKEELENKAFFYLDAIEYLSVNLSDSRLNFSNFENHSYQMIFTLEDNANTQIDPYGRYITKWTGNQVTGIIREQS